MTTPLPLAQERDALSQILDRLMSEETSLENLCKLAPRIISVAANVARIQSVLEAVAAEAAKASQFSIDRDAISRALAELTAEITTEYEAPTL